jgi:thioredoxin 1
MPKLRLPAFLFVAALVVLAAIAFTPQGARSQAAPTRTATSLSLPTLAIGPTATATRERSRLVSPTPSPTAELPDYMQTLNAAQVGIIATFENIPTRTPGPQSIALTGKPHYVKFYADWCGPCRMMRPAVEKMKAKYGDQVTFWDIDIDNIGSRRLNIAYRIEFIPLTMLLDADGKTAFRLEGYQTEEELDAALTALLERAGNK